MTPPNKSSVPLGLNSMVTVGTIKYLVDTAEDTPRMWSKRKLLPKPRGLIAGHKFWTASDILAWLFETGRANLIRPEWLEINGGQIIEGGLMPDTEGYYEP